MDGAPHFSEEEFACKCGCGRVKVSGELLAGLEDLRQRAGLAIVIHRGYSCADHNLAVGGKADGQHPEGTAADIGIPPLSLQQMYELALQVPQFKNGGIGVYDGKFLHVDARGHKARWARVGKEYVSIESSGLVQVME
jgi:uncharacterized protein YcbK (DUF882 family)